MNQESKEYKEILEAESKKAKQQHRKIGAKKWIEKLIPALISIALYAAILLALIDSLQIKKQVKEIHEQIDFITEIEQIEYESEQERLIAFEESIEESKNKVDSN